MFRSRFTKTAVSMLAAALLGVLTMVGCSDDDNGNDDGRIPGDYDPDVIGSEGWRLVGDWTPVEYSDRQNYRWFYSFNSNGDLCMGEYQKVDNFWIDGTYCAAQFRADGNTFSITPYEGYIDDFGITKWSISGNTMTWSWCWHDEYDDEEYCEDMVLTKGASRPTSNVRSMDSALNGTDWRMGSGGRLGLWSDGLDISGVDYLSVYYELEAWYTSGNRLYMLGLEKVPNSCRTFIDPWDDYEYESDCAYTVAEQIEFTYTHIPRTSLTLRNDSRGINDVWEYYDGYYKHQTPHRRSQPPRALSKR